MNYYLVQAGAIISGPHGVGSHDVRRITACGNPELLPLATLRSFGLVPEQRAELAAGQGYGTPVLQGNVVHVPAVDVPPTVPAQVTKRQARAVLIVTGLLPAVEAAIDAIPDPLQKALARNEWEESAVVERHRGLVSQMAASLGLTEAQLDAMFIQAAAIP
jgi:hypothetical protein